MMDPGLSALLEKHRKYFQQQDTGRIVCTLNKHSLPANRQAVETFINGRKYAQLKRKADEAAALQKFEPFLLPSRNFPGQLYCALTCQVMQAKLETVKKHMSGKRFAAAKAEFETDNRELMEEPDVSDTASSGQDQEEAEQALDAEVAIDVQDHGASPMEEDVLPEAACPEIFSTDMMLSLWYQNYPQKLAISASNNTVAHTSSQGQEENLSKGK